MLAVDPLLQQQNAWQQQLASTAEDYYPSLRYEKVDAHDLKTIYCDTHVTDETKNEARYQQSNRIHIQQLYNCLREQYPQAGESYYKARCWSLLYWQPLYLSLIAVHKLHSVFDPQSMVLHAKDNSIWGYHLSDKFDHDYESHSQKNTTESLIDDTSQKLSKVICGLYLQLTSLFSFSKNKAERLLASNLLEVLRRLFETNTKHERVQNISFSKAAKLWLSHLKIEHQTDFQSKNGTIIIHHKACCMSYKIGSELCQYCPKSRCRNLK